jgi:uncharacterized protein involved in exopolysaccharide biosynthesis
MLVYDQPIDRAKPIDPAQPKRLAGFELFELSRLLWRRKLMIVAAALVCACAAVIVGKSLSPKFTATAELYVDPRELQLVDRELTPRAQDVSGLSMVVESQARLITSNSVLQQVIQDIKLDTDPEFGDNAASLLGSLLGRFGLAPRDAGQVKLDQTTALEALNRHITIRKTERSFVVDIDVWSREPAKAAMLANAIASAYLAESRSSQATAARRATGELSGRLKELRARLRDAEEALATYKAQNNFVGTQDTLLSDQQLSASNQRLAAAHAMTLDAQAKYDQIEAGRRAASDPGAIPEALQSPTIANLRAQYAEARKHYAELTAELGPRHPALRQMQQQVEDLRRVVNEEVDRFAQSAKNDLARARDYETSLNRALEAQKRQSMQLSQASVRLRELEREIDASRDVYQSFLKRSRETEEQESLNTSAARVIGEATVPQRRTFPPAMSLLAMLGLVFGALAAAGWAVAVDRLSPETIRPEPADAAARPPARAPKPVPETSSRPQAPIAAIEKPLIARLQDCDVMCTLAGILGGDASPDVTRFGWPVLRPGIPRTTLRDALRDIRAAIARRCPDRAMPVVAVIGVGESYDRSIAALNFALAASRDNVGVLLIDADRDTHLLSDQVSLFDANAPGRLGIGGKPSRIIPTANGISILPAMTGSDIKTASAIGNAIAQARAAGSGDLVVLDGPVLPFGAADRRLIELADGIVAVLPVSLDINHAMEEIITALGADQHKLAGVILNELSPVSSLTPQRDKQYA